ncbi:hypothetical protein ACFVUS_09800 [Nocardia sp. NPDC058058]|uniref:hypothetical protein n=1 Tax=Nocardia sp. NPDC058058 TaxID=3346317 RepID=UPI0036D83A31
MTDRLNGPKVLRIANFQIRMLTVGVSGHGKLCAGTGHSMVKDHARKNAAKALMAKTGYGYQKSDRESRRRYLFFPITQVWNGVEKCVACDGSGVDRHCLYPKELGRCHPVLVPPVCSICRGCGCATHEQCPPLHTGDAARLGVDYFRQLELSGEPARDCRSCHDLQYCYELAIGRMELIPDTPDIALEKVRSQAAGRPGNIRPGYSLFVPNGLEYLRFPCACARDGDAQVVSAKDL